MIIDFQVSPIDMNFNQKKLKEDSHKRLIQ